MWRRAIYGWIAIVVAVSIVAQLDGTTMRWLALDPARIWRGEVWRLVTWILVSASPLGIVVASVGIYRFGGALAEAVGARRLVRCALEIAALSGIATALVALASPTLWHYRHVGSFYVFVMVILWARQFPDHTYVFMGVLPLRRFGVVAVVFAYVVLLSTPPHVTTLPTLFAMALASVYPLGRLRERSTLGSRQR